MSVRSFLENVPEHFYRGGQPACYTVGDLIKQLQMLPHNMPVTLSGDEPVCAVIYNAMQDHPGDDENVAVTLEEATQ